MAECARIVASPSTLHPDSNVISMKWRRFGLAELILSIELCLVFFFSLRTAVDPDYGWHIVNGRHVLDGTTLSGIDVYSWTAERIWVAHEWLTEFVMSLVHDAAGPSANSLLAASLTTSAYALVAMTLLRRGVGWFATLVALPIAFLGAMRSVGVRPQVLELLYLSLLIFFIEWFIRQRAMRMSFLLIVAIAGVVWANTHGSFLLLPAVLAITSAELLVGGDSRWKNFLAGSAVAAASFVLNPWTTELYSFAMQSFSSATTLSSIQEWQRPKVFDAQALPLLLQVALATIGAVSVIRSPAPGVRDPGARFVGLLRVVAFAVLAFRSGRHVMLFGIAGSGMIASGIGIIWGGFSERTRGIDTRRRSDVEDRSRTLINIAATLVVAVSVAIAGWQVVSPASQERAVATRYPVRLAEVARANWRPGEMLFNQYDWGGFLIEKGILPVFIDGRSELYGDEQLERYRSITHLEHGWERRLDSLDVSMVMMSRAQPLPERLQHLGWTTLASDSVGILVVRKSR